MSDPRRPEGSDPNRPQWSQPTEQMGSPYPPVDPAYGATYSYPGYVPSAPPLGPEPTQQLPPYWTQTQYQPPPPPPDEPPPGPPKSPRWLWVLAGAAVLLVVGLVDRPGDRQRLRTRRHRGGPAAADARALDDRPAADDHAHDGAEAHHHDVTRDVGSRHVGVAWIADDHHRRGRNGDRRLQRHR